MTTTPVETLTKYRYWWLTPEGEPVDLRPIGNQDRTKWGPGTTTAACRHDETHVPPHPGCTCGLYAVGVPDIEYAVKFLNWRYQKTIEFYLRRTFGLRWSITSARQTAPPMDPLVIARVQLHNAVPRYTAISGIPAAPQIQSWRAATATIEAFYLPPNAEYAADALTAKYDAPCIFGYPEYTQEDWDARTMFDGQRTDPHLDYEFPTYASFGMYPPADRAAS